MPAGGLLARHGRIVAGVECAPGNTVESVRLVFGFRELVRVNVCFDGDFAVAVCGTLACDTMRLEIFFDDHLLDLMNKAADLESVASYESATLFAPPARHDNTRNESTRCESASEFVDAIRNVSSTAVILTAECQPMTEDTGSYFDVYEAADAARDAILK